MRDHRADGHEVGAYLTVVETRARPKRALLRLLASGKAVVRVGPMATDLTRACWAYCFSPGSLFLDKHLSPSCSRMTSQAKKCAVSAGIAFHLIAQLIVQKLSAEFQHLRSGNRF